MLVVASLILLAAAPGISRLRLRTDGNALIAPGAPEVQSHRVVRDCFGIEDNIVALVRRLTSARGPPRTQFKVCPGRFCFKSTPPNGHHARNR